VAGVDAIVIPQRRSVSVTGDAIKTSVGALLKIPVCRETSLQYAIQYLKDCGIEPVAIHEQAKNLYTETDFCRPLALVLGSEDQGIYEKNLQLCTVQASIPQYGSIASLNVSVAAGVVIYEVLRQRNKL
jgi:23S rRNA (guanosine2251-2'-O)-methyltransferase